MNKGFTLIELMIVVAILSILAAVAIPAYQDHHMKEVCEGNQYTPEPVDCTAYNRRHHPQNVPVTPAPTAVSNARCYNGYLLTPAGTQLLDNNGRGIACH